MSPSIILLLFGEVNYAEVEYVTETTDLLVVLVEQRMLMQFLTKLYLFGRILNRNCRLSN